MLFVSRSLAPQDSIIRVHRWHFTVVEGILPESPLLGLIIHSDSLNLSTHASLRCYGPKTYLNVNNFSEIGSESPARFVT